MTATGCEALPYERYFTGFKLKGERGILTALHAVVGCQQTTAVSSDNNTTTFSDLRIRQVDLDRDAALLLTATDEPNTSGGLEKGFEVLAEERLTVWGFPYAFYRLLDTPLTVHQVPFATWIGTNPETVKMLNARGGSPSLTAQMININGFFVPGHSGAPLINEKNEVVAIGGGGIQGLGFGLASPVWQLNLKDIDDQDDPRIKVRLDLLRGKPIGQLFAVADNSSQD
jgi:hypothetical protein